jgi:hypothetical protein
MEDLNVGDIVVFRSDSNSQLGLHSLGNTRLRIERIIKTQSDEFAWVALASGGGWPYPVQERLTDGQLDIWLRNLKPASELRCAQCDTLIEDIHYLCGGCR